jgi:beta-N-acetylhexosaminidase
MINCPRSYPALLSTILFLSGCGTGDQIPSTDSSSATLQLGPEAPLDAEGREWVERTLSQLTVREMAGQVTMLWTPGNYLSIESDEFERDVKGIESGAGGFYMMGGLPHARTVKLNALQAHANIPLLSIGWGLGMQFYASRRDTWLYGGGTDVPSAMAYAAIGDPSAVREAGRIIGLESRATGVNFIDDNGGVNLLTNLANVLQNRSYGDDPEYAGRMAAAFIEGVHDAGILAYVGFFPGAGNITGDPHVELPVASNDRERFYAFDFVPFRHAIRAGVDVVMTSHFAAPGLTGSTSLPATFSSEITRILREDLGFKGLLITDDLSMGGISNTHNEVEAAIEAFKAGTDLLLGAYTITAGDAVAGLVESGEVPKEQLVASVRRILEAKARLGLHKRRYAPLDEVNKIVGHRDHQRAANDAADRSIVLLRDQKNLVPLAAPSDLRVLSVTFEREDNEVAGNRFNAELRSHVKSVDVERAFPDSDPSLYEDLDRRAMDADRVVLSVYIRPQLGVSQYVELSEDFVRFARRLQTDGHDVVLISFGKLTVLDALPNLETFMLAWSEQPVMQRAAARALVGVIPITAHLPVSLPPHHERGDGLVRKDDKG